MPGDERNPDGSNQPPTSPPSGEGTFVGPVAPPKPAPNDPSIPAGWPTAWRPTTLVKSFETLNGDCKSWYEVRCIFGPTRPGAFTPLGAPLLMPIYQGGCKWQIGRVQQGTRQLLQLQQLQYVLVTQCPNKRTEEILFNGDPSWAVIGQTFDIEVSLIGQPFQSQPPPGGRCPDEYWPFYEPLPGNVRDELNRATPGEKAKDPTVKPLPVPWPPEPPEPPGPWISPMPGPPEPPEHDEQPHHRHKSPQEEEWEKLVEQMEREKREWRQGLEEGMDAEGD
jgi:hypothetical protein